MSVSAESTATQSDLLERTLELYRDLSVALREQITRFKGSIGETTDCTKEMDAAVKSHQRVLLTVLEIEAGLVKRSRAWGGSGGELDLDSARAEILARLALWPAEG